MATQLNSVHHWNKTLSLDRQNSLQQHLLNILPTKTSPPSKSALSSVFAPLENTSFLHSQKLRQSLLESRTAFLNLPATTKQETDDDNNNHEQRHVIRNNSNNHNHNKTVTKKVSFKIKNHRTSVINQKTMTLSANKVAELTQKFNTLSEKSSILEQPKFRKLVIRVNSQRSVDSDKNSRRPSVKTREVSRKPSVKTKPIFNNEERLVVKRKILRKPSVNNKNCIRAKISYLETPHVAKLEDKEQLVVKINRPTSLNLPVLPPKPVTFNNRHSTSDSPTSGSVRAAIEIFERRNSQTSPIIVPPNTPTVVHSNNDSNQVHQEVPKPKVPENKFALDIINNSQKTEDEVEIVQIVNIPAILPQRRCDSMYETSNLKRINPISSRENLKQAKSEEVISVVKPKPNTSFLWKINQDKSPSGAYNPFVFLSEEQEGLKEELHSKINEENWEDLYDFVDPQIQAPEVPPRVDNNSNKPPLLPKKNDNSKKIAVSEEKIYEELNVSHEEDVVTHSYDYCKSIINNKTQKIIEEEDKYEVVGSSVCSSQKVDDGYEYCASPTTDNPENIYETLPPPLLPRRQQLEPLPPRPPSRNNSYCTIQNSENMSNCYESIYNPESNCKLDVESNYESIYGCHIRVGGSKRDSLVSSDQQSNSLYGRASLAGWAEDESTLYSGKATSDLSSSDRSDDWVDLTDNEDHENANSGMIIIREKQKSKKSSGWSQQLREQRSKTTQKFPPDQGVDSDTDHHYESLYNTSKSETPDDDYDSFESDAESEQSFTRNNLNDSGVDIGNSQLPDPPNNQPYVLTRLAATAGKHMRKLRRNWSLTKNDISKSLSRMTKRKSRTDLDSAGTLKKEQDKRKSSPEIIHPKPGDETKAYQNVDYQKSEAETNSKSLPRKGFLNKFRRSMSLSAELASEVTTNLENKPKSTFYLTEDIDIDDGNNESEASRDSGASLSSPVQRNSVGKVIRPQSPPPPAPILINNNKKDNGKRATSWYAEVGLFNKNSELNNPVNRRPNTFWYAEVGLYQTSKSTPSTSSAENSGNNYTHTSIIKPDYFINHDNSEEYYNFKNGNNYNTSIDSFSSTETKKDTSITPDIQLRLLDEPLYQFYDAAVLESVCHDGTQSDFDSDGYEEVGDKSVQSDTSSHRPSAMDLVSPNKNAVSFSRSLWCEIPEVIQSSVLSTLSVHQKKLQEAKFEMVTSEASYLNSLNVLTNHFITSLKIADIVTTEELEILFGKVEGVKNCSEKLLHDLEKCWQDNILLHGVCDIVQKHAEENFSVYVGYCENQILLDETLKKIKERPGFLDILKQLECSSACQSLTLYSFLMLPMQRITRLPLLVDAVLKRLSPQDSEYLTCQYALATLNKIVSQCNEGARNKERENEMKKICNQLEFSKSVPPVDIIAENRWLIRSGTVTHMQQRTDETKLTFGKRFSKISLHLFLFNDLLFVTKPRSENSYTIIHYCPRNLVELSSADVLTSVPVKEAQGRHLLFMTMLENQNEKTVEFLLSCSSESDRERWIEALTPPRSEDPDETLYECWDCPQVTAVHNYLASQPDELAMSRGDVINVLRKMADGWYHGERIRDGQTGWFPANYCVEIANPHVRSRNLKQRYRLLAFSENYLKTK